MSFCTYGKMDRADAHFILQGGHTELRNRRMRWLMSLSETHQLIFMRGHVEDVFPIHGHCVEYVDGFPRMRA